MMRQGNETNAFNVVISPRPDRCFAAVLVVLFALGLSLPAIFQPVFVPPGYLGPQLGDLVILLPAACGAAVLTRRRWPFYVAGFLYALGHGWDYAAAEPEYSRYFLHRSTMECFITLQVLMAGYLVVPRVVAAVTWAVQDGVRGREPRGFPVVTVLSEAPVRDARMR